MLTAQDRQDIEDLLRAYARAMDFGEIDAVAALFTDDGRVRDISGALWDTAAGGPRGFATRWLTPPGARRGQHWMQHMDFEPLGPDACRVLSYWFSARWTAESPTPTMNALGLYTDTVVRQNGRWRIQEKIIERWVTAGADTPPR